MGRKRVVRTLADWLAVTEMSQTAVAKRVGVPQSKVSEWARCEAYPHQRHWPKLAELTGLPIAAFMQPKVAAALAGRL